MANFRLKQKIVGFTNYENVESVERVNADNLKAPAQTQAVAYYIVQVGDSFSKVA